MSGANDNEGLSGLRRRLAAIAPSQPPTDSGFGDLRHFCPGLTALPGVTVLAQPQWRYRESEPQEAWAPGEILALAGIGDTSPQQTSSFFTPIAPFRFPRAELASVESTGAARTSGLVAIRRHDPVRPIEIQVLVLPWDSLGEGAHWDWAIQSRLLQHCAGSYLRGTTVELQGPGGALGLETKWGLQPFPIQTSLEALRFCFNNATCMLAPAVFRVQITPEQFRTVSGGNGVGGECQLKFATPEHNIQALYAAAGIGRSVIPACEFFPNAMPVMNVDLRAWLKGQQYREFLQQISVRPLGIAGVHVWHQDSGPSTDAHPLGADTLFHFAVEPSSGTLENYWSIADVGEGQETQLLVWTTEGAALNGRVFQYIHRSEQQPRERTSTAWIGAFTPLPALGGLDCSHAQSNISDQQPMLTIATPPQMFAYGDTITLLTRDIMMRLGYPQVQVRGPHAVLRVIRGVRRHASLMIISNDGGQAISPTHQAALKQYLRELAPIGHEILVEFGDG